RRSSSTSFCPSSRTFARATARLRYIACENLRGLPMAHLDVIREIRRKLAIDGPPRVRAPDDFAMVTLPERDCDAIRDLLIAERPGTVIEIGLAYGSSALAIGEALISVGGDRHVILDPFQASGFRDAGWEVIRSAQLDGI